MENFIFSLNSTLPVFLIIVAGYFFMKIKLFNEEFIRVTDKFAFKVTLPVMLFLDVAQTDIRSMFSGKFVAFCMLGTALMFLGIWGLCLLFMKDRDMIGAFAMSSARGSAAVLGVAFADNIFGDAGMTAMMIMASVPLYNIFSVLFLTLGAKHRDKSISLKQQAVNVLKGIVTNPLIISIFLGVVFAGLKVTLPVIPYKFLNSLGSTATPMALLVVGASFDWEKAWLRIKPTLLASAIKLIILPCIFMPLAISLGFNGPQLIAILTMTGSPTTVACYIMAKNMDNDYVLTSSIVMVTTLFSSVTLTIWVYILKVMEFI
ncbi:MAG: AEC family transporter [Lachnospiraceae bacterium]